MSRLATSDLPLRNIREEANVSLEDMAEILSRAAGRPISIDYVKLIEYRGTDRYPYLSAYAEATGKHISLIAAAAKKSKNKLSN